MIEPLVSIIIPCYNGAACVGDAIESALNQTYDNKEVVVVDDGSTDNSLSILKQYGTRIQLITGVNSGVAAARNKGAAASQGALLQFLDQDDKLHPDKLERQVPLAVTHRPGMVFCDADVLDFETGQYRGRWGTGSISTLDPVVHVLRTVLQTSGPLHWRETFQRIKGFRVHTPPCEDRDLHLRLACAGVRFHHLSERMYVLRRSATGQSSRNREAGLRMDVRIAEDAYSMLLDLRELTDLRRLAFSCFFAGVGRRALRQGFSQLADGCFRRAREIHAMGLFEVYSAPARLIARVAGPHFTEWLAVRKRRLLRNREIA